jgi:Glycosyltransferase Family 4
MRVAFLAPPWFPVPPKAYGGIEAVVALLSEGLVEAGVDVTLFASGDSETAAELHAVFPSAPSEQIGLGNWELEHVLECVARRHEFDIVHDHTGPIALSRTAKRSICSRAHAPCSSRSTGRSRSGS